ncbi:hypothetical protein KC334_g7185 [Hortaea werneckii]|nr:hypothetical protein KC334_g7185 [Hortaea werneckii]
MIHEPLLEDGSKIRLLTLRNRQVREQYDRAEQRERDSELTCDLDNFSFNPPTPGNERRRSLAAHGAILPGFLALSYAWAQDSQQRHVSVNGESTEVTGNLNSGLEAIEASPIIRDVYKVWADAICIDQGNVQERNREVARMRDVYRASANIMIWLGEASDESDLAFDFICGVAHAWGRGLREAQTYLRSTVPRKGVQLFRALTRLISRSYWGRTWIIQEVACGNADTLVLCGRKSTVWSDFLLTYSSFRPYRHTQPSYLSRIFQDVLQEADARVRDSYREHVRYWEWEKCDQLQSMQEQMASQACCNTTLLLHRVRRVECALPQDKVYGILGLLEKDIRSNIVVDYTLPFTSVYRMFARAYAETPDGLKILLESGQEEDLELENAGMPSWVPDLRYEQRHYRGNDEPEYNAHSGTQSHLKWSEDSKVLYAEGIIFDTIDGVSGRLSNSFDQVPNDLVPSTCQTPVYGDSTALRENFWRALVGNRDLTGNTPDERFSSILHLAIFDPNFQPLKIAKNDTMAGHAFDLHHFLLNNSAFTFAGRPLKEYFSSRVSLAEATDPSWGHTDPGSAARPYIAAVRRCREFLYARRLATTVGGYMAVLPFKARAGDRVAVFLGCSCPILLRSTAKGYKVVSACYVQGLMDGKAISMLHSGRVTSEMIKLI